MGYEEARRQKLEELKRRQAEEEAVMEAEAKIGSALRGLLTEEARTRLNNVGLVNRETYLKAAQLILYLHRAGQLQGKVTEEEVRLLLDKVRDKREIKIKRK